ncbi:MAG: hypothetical protein OXC96_02930 [Cyanobacteria bacterium MAG CAR1_bin_15]|nr:hypothetical protein [Cyanobacteria bacterium MAG CAR1_bin_15]
MLKILWTLFSGFGLLVFVGFILIGAFIADHWQELLLVLLFLSLLLLGAFVFTVIGMLAKDDIFKEGMKDFLTWLKWVIIPASLQSDELKDKIKKLQIQYGEASDKQATEDL